MSTDPEFIAAIEYPSGRRIFLGRNPHCGQFYPEDQRHRCQRYPDERTASVAIESLLSYFQIRDRSPLTLHILPAASLRKGPATTTATP